MDKEIVAYIYTYIYIYTHTHTHIYIYTHTHTHTHDGILFSHKEKEILPFARTQVNPEDIMLNNISQRQEDKYCMISFGHGI